MRILNKKVFLITVVLALTVCMMWHMTVQAKENQITVDRETFLEKEELYKESIRTELNKMGYGNAGITLTSIFHKDGSICYTSKIHHKRIDKMSESERALLKKTLDQFASEEKFDHFEHDFLIYE